MYLYQVEAFVAVVNYKSFSKAAKKLYLSQPTISAYIKALENELGTQLIYRTTKDVILSDAGKTFYTYAQELIRIRDISLQEMQKFSNKVSGNLNIIASSFPAQYVMPKLIRKITQEYPEISFSLKQVDGESVINHIENYSSEIGITDFTTENSKCNFEPFLYDKLVLVTPNTEEYRKMNGVFPVERLLTDPIVWRDEGAATNKETTAFLASLGYSPEDLNISIRMPSVDSAKQAVLNNLGISFISHRAIATLSSIGGVLVFDFDSDLLIRTLYLITHKNRVLSPLGKFFVDFAKNHYKNFPSQ